MSVSSTYQRGQVLLIAVLVMVVALTVGLAVATRTISNLRTSTEEESSQRAFSAAEAGIEQALRLTNNATIAASFDNNTTFTATAQRISGTEIVLNNGDPVAKDDAVDIWLSNYGDYGSQWSGNLTIYWSPGSTTCNPSPAVNTRAALEVIVLHGASTSAQATHHVYDPCSPRNQGNNFTDPTSNGGGTIAGTAFSYRTTIAVTQGLFVRVIPLYAPTKIAAVGSAALPSQGWILTSLGEADCTTSNESGCTVHKLVSYKPYPKLPVEFFPSVIFSP